jgi:hypothetical protein
MQKERKQIVNGLTNSQTDYDDLSYLKVLNYGRNLVSASQNNDMTRLWDLQSSSSSKLKQMCQFKERIKYPIIEELDDHKFVIVNNAVLNEYSPMSCTTTRSNINITKGVVSMKSFNGQYLALGYKTSIQILDIKNNFKGIKTLTLNGDLKDMDVSANFILASTTNGLIKIWDNKLIETKTINGEKGQGTRWIDDNTLLTWTGSKMCIWKNLESSSEFCEDNKDTISDLILLKSEYLEGGIKNESVVSWLTITTVRNKWTIKRWTFSENKFSSLSQTNNLPEKSLHNSLITAQLNRNALYKPRNC